MFNSSIVSYRNAQIVYFIYLIKVTDVLNLFKHRRPHPSLDYSAHIALSPMKTFIEIAQYEFW